MADTTALLDSAPNAAIEPGQRGRLDVADRAVVRLATYTAAQVPGVVAHRDLLRSAAGRTLPRASAQVSGLIVAVDLEVAVAWGSSLDEVARETRSRVHDQLQLLAAVQVTRVNVTVRHIARDNSAQPRVR